MGQHHFVFLVPGFLGFERSGNFSTFAERVASALRTHLEDRLAQPVPVVAVPWLPTDSLAGRQRALLEAIARQAPVGTDAIDHIHLVGHGVGGVDGQLLTCTTPLDGGSWERLHPRGAELTGKLRTLISLASPHHGTELATAPGAGTLTAAGILRDPDGALRVLDLLRLLMGSAWSGIDRDDFLFAAAREGRKVTHFVQELMRWQQLLLALSPLQMSELYRGLQPRDDVHRRSFVTLAGQPAPGQGAPFADAFFSEIQRRTAGGAGSFLQLGPETHAGVERLRTAARDPQRLIMSPRTALPDGIDASTNDGIVNSARQLVSPRDEGELSHLVVADHFDVLGYYERPAWVHGTQGQSRRRSVVSGLLNSGSCFRDDEFFALYRAIGEDIANGITAASKAPTKRKTAAKKRSRKAREDRPAAKA